MLGNMAFSQASNDRCRWISVFNQPFALDTLSLAPGSFMFPNGDKVDVVHSLASGKVTFKRESGKDSILVCYKVLPFKFHQRYFHRDLHIYDSNALFKDPVVENKKDWQRDELFNTPDLNKSGTISRGISFGNNQDVFVNSTLNLNLDGQLTDDLKIRASITDQNVPYQPEGNTQQLQDFDNVFIQVYNDNITMTGGDVVLKNRPSQFLRFYKNVQGGQAEVRYKLGKGDTAVSSAGISVAKGRFASVQVDPIEGSLGPYRIPGPNNEAFVIVLANSERVFLDGVQLERGFNKDYIIDYNIGEITFTNRVLITEFSRLRVDYEFSDQEYNRTIATASHYHDFGKLKLFFNTYSESDNRNRPLLVELTNEDKQFLSTIGDDLQQAVASGVDSVEFNNEQILYKRLDTVDADGNLQRIYKFSTNPDSARFRITFSNVGAGNGNYLQTQATANGRVFEWVSPIMGVPQGDFEPVIRVPVPDKRQMTTVGGSYSITRHEEFFSEMAFSTNDINLFSEFDSEDDRGFAVKMGIKSQGRDFAPLKGYKINSFLDFEYDDQYFNPIDRFRYIEYDRDWSYDPTTDLRRYEDHILNTGVEIVKDEANRWGYTLSRRKRGEQVDGYQHRFTVYQALDRFQLKSSAFLMRSDPGNTSSVWNQWSADLSYPTAKVIPGYLFRSDRNVVRDSESDSVSFSAMYFDEHTGYLRNGKESKLNFDLRYSYREDQRPLEGAMDNFSASQTTRLTLDRKFKNNRFETVFIYRKLDLAREGEDEETLSGRLDWTGHWFDRHVRSELTYSVANSRELRREFIYINVPAGQGTHTWRDLNNDNVQDLNEFFEALNPDERNYAKIFLPSNEFITAFQNLFVYRVNIDMPRSWKNQGGLKSFLSRFSNNTSWTADNKITDERLGARLLTFARNIEEELLLSERNNLRSTLFYNRTHSAYGIEGVYTNQQVKQLLTNGFERRSFEEYAVNTRVNLNRSYNLRFRAATNVREADSDFLSGREYKIDGYRLNPEFSWQPGQSFRLSFQYVYTSKENNLTAETGEEAIFNEGIMELRFNKAIQNSLNAQFRWVDIDFVGEENSPLGYELLEALRPGTNLTWSLNWQQKITSGLQLNVGYDGRKSGEQRVIHIGRVQISALF